MEIKVFKTVKGLTDGIVKTEERNGVGEKMGRQFHLVFHQFFFTFTAKGVRLAHLYGFPAEETALPEKITEQFHKFPFLSRKIF